MKKIEDRYAHWQSIMERYENSALSQPEFCIQNQIDFKKFRYYRWQLPRVNKIKIEDKPKEVKLTPVLLKPAETSLKLHIKHPSGIECYVPLNLGESEWLHLMRSLLTC